jgi:hypothetical protein
MPTIDEIGARAAAAARADAANIAATRVEDGLERIRLEGGPIVGPRPRSADRRRLLAVGFAAALTAAAIIALVVNTGDSESRRVVPATEPTQLVPTPRVVSTTTPPDATVLATVTPDTVGAAVADAIAVSYDALPPAFPAAVFVSLPPQAPLVAIGDTHIVAIDGSTATLIDPIDPISIPPQSVQLAVTTTRSIAAGPGDVLYAVVQGDGIDIALDAIALSGERAGQVVASAPVGVVTFAEAPDGVLGHGADGIIDRRTGETLLGYVDPSGAPISFGRATHQIAVAGGDLRSGDMVVTDPDGAHEWHLKIVRDPTSPTPEFGENVAPSSHGGAVVWSAVGPPQSAGADIPSPTEPVVAVLAADGTGTWYSLADGWQVAASDIDGTILVRSNGSTTELARLDPPQRIDFLDQPAAPNERVFFAQTLPTTLTTADPCSIDNLDAVPEQGGAMGTQYGVVSVRNTTAQACEISGVPDVAFLDAAGNVVQSTDPALLGQPGAEPIVLEPDSWADAPLGPIASNVCGGNESSQFRLTLGGESTTMAFAVGRPFDPDSCSPDFEKPPVAGALAVQPFAPLQPNEGTTNPFDGLQMTLEAPSSVRAGDVLHYDVVFTATGAPVIIDNINCPVYLEKLGSAGAQLLLNCNGSHAILIQTGESVRFHIELPIPADAVAGSATLSWAPIEPAGDAVTATVIIVA